MRASDSPTEIVKVFMGITALRLFSKFPDLRRRLWGNRLWSPANYIATHGVASIETIQSYIESQFTELHPPVKTACAHYGSVILRVRDYRVFLKDGGDSRTRTVPSRATCARLDRLVSVMEKVQFLVDIFS